MDTIRIYHNPRCSKSRETLSLLEERGIEPEIIKYLETPPDGETIRSILGLLGIEPRDLMRTGEQVYVDLDLERVDDPDELIRAMVEHPILIERPIVIRGDAARLGRPPERVLEIL